MESLEYNVKCDCHCLHRLSLPTTLKQLKLLSEGRLDDYRVTNALRYLPQLTRLALYDRKSRDSLPDGRIWEKFIQSSLPLLKTFQFCFIIFRLDASSNYLNQAVASFSTPFYLLEKRWFIQCHSSGTHRLTGVLYSLPFAFAEMPLNIASLRTTMTTSVNNEMDKTKYESYKKIKILRFSGDWITHHLKLSTSNIVKLVLYGKFSTLSMPILSNLRHMEIRRSESVSSNDFAQLLANTPKLRSLTIPSDSLEILTDSFTNTAVCNYLSEYIQSLTLGLAKDSTFISDVVDACLFLLLFVFLVRNANIYR